MVHMDVFTTFGTTYLGGSCTQWSIRNAPIGVDAPVGGVDAPIGHPLEVRT